VGEDRTPPNRRTTVAEAAELLGISAEAVRGRIRRGTLPVEREGGTVYVLVDDAMRGRTTADQSRTTGDQPTDRTDLLIAEMQDRIQALEDANRENRRIIAALTQRIPAIEAPSQATPSETPSEAPESPQMHTVGGVPRGGDTDSPDHHTPSERERPWWRRLFGE
jgi:Helix-turn-helix domain